MCVNYNSVTQRVRGVGGGEWKKLQAAQQCVCVCTPCASVHSHMIGFNHTMMAGPHAEGGVPIQRACPHTWPESQGGTVEAPAAAAAAAAAAAV
jgi:hypothetical protein